MKRIILFIVSMFTFIKAGEINNNEFLQTQKYLCEDGSAEACGIVGTIYSVEDFAKQYNVTIDYFIANKYLEKACNGNDGIGCFNLGVSFDLGEGVSKNNTKAYELYEKACNLNHAMACYAMGGFFNAQNNEKQALEYFIKSCDLKNKDACNNAGAIFFNNDNIDSAFTYFKKACEYGDNWGCKNMHTLEQ